MDRIDSDHVYGVLGEAMNGRSQEDSQAVTAVALSDRGDIAVIE